MKNAKRSNPAPFWYEIIFLLELMRKRSAPREIFSRIFGGLLEMGPRCQTRAGADQVAPRLRMNQEDVSRDITAYSR